MLHQALMACTQMSQHRMSGRRISKRALASLGGIVKVGLWVPPPVPPSGEVGPWPGYRQFGLGPQYSSSCSGCHSDDPDASAERGRSRCCGYLSIQASSPH
ncbi:hypothetical protein AVEN_2143-1 [Araneus ventricosus]|uniref:Uncharacterized protein n=1 Tax=Araneus ventricosus TaxID=182803 RepID=A0A4Y2JYZ6_ARAVE|nr:hypothetical protein AVEN_2143-1 [Araneus ventricosus]